MAVVKLSASCGIAIFSADGGMSLGNDRKQAFFEIETKPPDERWPQQLSGSAAPPSNGRLWGALPTGGF
jgi:hypothetical protein